MQNTQRGCAKTATFESRRNEEQEAPGSPYSCAEGYKLYKVGTQGVHVRQTIRELSPSDNEK